MDTGISQLQTDQNGLTLSLQRIDQLSLDEDRIWWHTLRALNEFDRLHADYRSTINSYRDVCFDLHWTASLIFSAISKNDRTLDDYVRLLRSYLYLIICDTDPSDTAVVHLVSQLSDFNRFASQTLIAEHELISKMLNTLFSSDPLKNRAKDGT